MTRVPIQIFNFTASDDQAAVVDAIMDSLAPYIKDEEGDARSKVLHPRFLKHSGPGAHPGTGSDQSVHGRGGAGNIESQPNTPQSRSGRNKPDATPATSISAPPGDPHALNEQENAMPPRPGIDDNPDIVAAAKAAWQQAAEIESEITPFLQGIAERAGGQMEGLEFRLKTERSLRRKMAGDMLELGLSAEEAAANIRDINRYTMTMPADETFLPKMTTALDSLEAAGWTIYDHKNKNFFAYTNDDYDGINIQLTNGTQFVELQFHTPQSFAIKQKSHALLEELRKEQPPERRAELLNQMRLLWTESRDHVPPGIETWGSPSEAILKALTGEGGEYYAYTPDGTTPLAIFCVEGDEVLRYDFDQGGLVPSAYDLPDLHGLGGSPDFLALSQEDFDRLVAEGLEGQILDVPNAAPTEPAEPAFTANVEVAKSDEHKNLVFGWASVALKDGRFIEDHQGDLIDVEDLEEAAYEFNIVGRATGDMHKSQPFGELVESMVVTQDKVDAGWPEEFLGRWWVGFRVPPEYHQQVREGKRKMFSIEGTAKRVPI